MTEALVFRAPAQKMLDKLVKIGEDSQRGVVAFSGSVACNSDYQDNHPCWNACLPLSSETQKSTVSPSQIQAQQLSQKAVLTLNISMSWSSTFEPGNGGRPRTISNRMHPTPLHNEQQHHNHTDTSYFQVHHTFQRRMTAEATRK